LTIIIAPSSIFIHLSSGKWTRGPSEAQFPRYSTLSREKKLQITYTILGP
jgi:hypothetical protein